MKELIETHPFKDEIENGGETFVRLTILPLPRKEDTNSERFKDYEYKKNIIESVYSKIIEIDDKIAGRVIEFACNAAIYVRKEEYVNYSNKNKHLKFSDFNKLT